MGILYSREIRGTVLFIWTRNKEKYVGNGLPIDGKPIEPLLTYWGCLTKGE